MIDEMVALLKKEQDEDDGKKACCTKSFGQTEDEAKVSAQHASSHRDAIADYKDQLSNTDARIERIAGEIVDVPIPQVMEETVDAVKLNPQDNVSGANGCRTSFTDSGGNWGCDPAHSFRSRR